MRLAAIASYVCVSWTYYVILCDCDFYMNWGFEVVIIDLLLIDLIVIVVLIDLDIR